MIADLVVKKLQELDELPDILAGVIWAAASKVDPTLNRRARPWRLLARLMNHTFLRRLIGVMAARSIYEQLEQVLAFDYHYLLQRGSLEVEAGDIRLAEQFLGQAYSLQPEDYRVETAYAYMLMRKAAETARDVGSQDLLTDGIDRLEDIIQVHGHETPYPFHVLGSQGLSWARRADFSSVEKRMFLEKILSKR